MRGRFSIRIGGCVCLLSLAAFSQTSNRGTISGEVRDLIKGSVRDAEIEVKQVNRPGEVSRTIPENNGAYTISVPPGQYKVSMRSPSLFEESANVAVESGTKSRVNFFGIRDEAIRCEPLIDVSPQHNKTPDGPNPGSGTLIVVVFDKTGAVVTGRYSTATLVLTPAQEGEPAGLTSTVNDYGVAEFRVDGGSYVLAVSAKGFSPMRFSVPILPSEITALSVVMSVGGCGDVVTVPVPTPDHVQPK